MSGRKIELVAQPGRQEIFVTREFNAPAEMVFRAHTDPTLFVRWYGCHGMTTTISEFDVRGGGVFRYSQTLNGQDFFTFKGVYHDVVDLKRIVRTVESESKPGRISLETTQFESIHGDRTKVITQTVFQSVEDRDEMIKAGVEMGSQESFQRLDDLLSKIKSR